MSSLRHLYMLCYRTHISPLDCLRFLTNTMAQRNAETHHSNEPTPITDIHEHKEQAYPHDPQGIEPGKKWIKEANPDHPEEELTQEDWIKHPPFRWEGSTGGKNGEEEREFVNKYVLECFCKRVQFTLASDPLDVKICHCDMCKKLHGAPMQAAAVFHKNDARLTKGNIGDIAFFSPGLSNPHMTSHATPTPRKIYCAGCGCPLADEGKNMFIAYPSSMHHWKSAEARGPGEEGANPPEEGISKLPPAFNVLCSISSKRKHIFYGKRAFDMRDGLEKWEGLNGQSRKMDDDGNIIEGGPNPSKELYQ
ncbi:hypothetical protein M422DRAFT_71597 [Sphaerobolus stellatus SS14]|uniref:CENP-V/GFA domain-containing protein n=1 Tax=Sphaerobolus stellatus (strain SS14) TaxID=990650 RepID=A0A0C9UQK3_SPHS4|nr:hypothetical protein M422DRAFT_71597 [Sphaerobolus stellatus SS14]